ncbi:MAG: alcohol dehydrogenase catalytic domain-containing protein [Actinomycetota bacterium]
MRALRVTGPREASVVELAEPELGDDELLIEVERAAMCATDVKLVDRGADPPRVPGHEIAGRLGDGTLVGVHPDIGCGECGFCRRGFENRCPQRESVGIDRDGGFAEWLAVPRSHVVPVELEVGLVPLLEPLACCIHAVGLMDVDPSDCAVIVGAGPMGLMCMWVLKSEGLKVGVCQRSARRRELAARLGADVVFGPDETVSKAIEGAPRCALVAAPGSAALNVALEGVAVGGVVHCFAGTPGGAKVDANLVHYRHLRLVGSTGSTLADYRRAVELVATHRVPLERLPTAVVPLDELPALLRGERARPEMKVLVSIQEG